MHPVKGAETGKARVHRPYFVVHPAHLVDANVATVLADARWKKRIVRMFRAIGRGKLAAIMEFPDFVPCPDREPLRCSIEDHPRRTGKMDAMRIQNVPVPAHSDHLLRITFRYDKGDTQLAEEGREVVRLGEGKIQQPGVR